MNKKGFTPLIVTIIVALIVGAGAISYQLARTKHKKASRTTPSATITTTKTTTSDTILNKGLAVYKSPKYNLSFNYPKETTKVQRFPTVFSIKEYQKYIKSNTEVTRVYNLYQSVHLLDRVKFTISKPLPSETSKSISVFLINKQPDNDFKEWLNLFNKCYPSSLLWTSDSCPAPYCVCELYPSLSVPLNELQIIRVLGKEVFKYTHSYGLPATHSVEYLYFADLGNKVLVIHSVPETDAYVNTILSSFQAD